jgi:hypothetical protein
VPPSMAHGGRHAAVPWTRRVRINVGRDVEPARARRAIFASTCGMRPQFFLYAALRCQISTGIARAPRNLEDFGERSVERVGFAALVRGVDAAVLRRDLRQLDDLVGLGEARGHVLQRGRKAERAVLHRVGDERLHLSKLGRGRGAVVEADDVCAHLRRADEGGEVDARALRVEPRKYSPSVRQSTSRL